MKEYPKLRRSEIRGGGLLSVRGKKVVTVCLILLAIASVFFYDKFSDWKHSRDFFGMWITERVIAGDTLETTAARAAIPGTTVIPERTMLIPKGIDLSERVDIIIKKSISLKNSDRVLMPGDHLLIYIEAPREGLASKP